MLMVLMVVGVNEKLLITLHDSSYCDGVIWAMMNDMNDMNDMNNALITNDANCRWQ